MSTKKALNQLAQAVRQLHDRQDKLEAAITASASASAGAGALEKFAVAAVEHQAQQLGAVGDLITSIANVAGERAARALGKRRAATAKRDPRGRMMRNACRLCENPALTDPQAAEIMAHATHGTGRTTPDAHSHGEGAPGAPVQLPAIPPVIPVVVQTDPKTGDQFVECEECGKPNARNGAAHEH